MIMMIRSLLSLLFLFLSAFLLADSATAAIISPFLNPKVEVVELDQHVQLTRRTLKDLKKQAILLQQQSRGQLPADEDNNTSGESSSEDDMSTQPDSEDTPSATSAALRLGANNSNGTSDKNSRKSSKKLKDSKRANKKSKGSKALKQAKKRKYDDNIDSSVERCPCAGNYDSEDVPTMCDCDGTVDGRNENMERMRSEYEFVMVSPGCTERRPYGNGSVFLYSLSHLL
jgi:hypothetical protein